MPPTPDQQNPPAASPDPQQQAAAATSGSAPSQATPIDQSSAAAVPAAAPTTAPASAAASVQAPANAQQQQHGIKHVLGDIFQTLAGGQKIVYTQGPNGPVKTYQDLKPGEMARGILAAAITGLASGYDPANRGKGPAMSSAFASGFKGEEQARDKQQANDQQQAQQQFVNEGVAEERKLRLQKAAQDQTESAQRMAESTAHTKIMVDEAAEHKELFTETRNQHNLDQINQNDADRNSMTVLKDSLGRPRTFATWEEAHEALLKDPNQLLHPGEYDTKIDMDPISSVYTVYEKPKGYDTKETERFAELDKDRNPMTYKDGPNKGQYIPNGQKGPDGQVMSPTPMTGARYDQWVKDTNKAKYENADYAYKKAMTNELIQKQKDQAETRDASDAFYRSNGQPFSINADTGLPYTTLRQRGILQNQAKTDFLLYGGQVETLKKDLQKATTDEERNTIGAELDEAQKQKTYWSGVLASTKPTNLDKSSLLAKSLVDLHTSDKGEVDAESALSQLDKNLKKYSLVGYTAQELAKVRQNIIAAGAERTQATTAAEAAANPKTAAEDFSKGESKKGEDQMAASVNQNAQEWQRPADPKTIGGGMSRIPQQQNPSFNDAEAYIAAHPNLTPDERAAVRNQNDIKNGKVRPPTIQIQGEDGKPKTIPDPKAEKAIQTLQGHDRNDIRQFIANQDKMTNEQKAALYNYYYLTPPSAKQ